MFNMTLLYMNRNIPLQAKILFGYMMLMAVIISMAAILFHEHARLRKIEADTYEIRQARRDISVDTPQHHGTRLIGRERHRLGG